MAPICYDTDLLKYSGTSQAKRILVALLNEYVKVDERKPADLIMFAKKYGAYLNYFDATNTINGNWQNFVSKDAAVIIAGISDLKTKDFTPFIENINKETSDASSDMDAEKYFKTIFDLVFTIASQLNSNLQQLPDDVSFKTFLSVTIASNLSAPLNVIYQYYQIFKAGLLIDETSTYIDILMPVDDVIFSQDFQLNTLGAPWQKTITEPSITLTGIIQDDIKHVITHNLFIGPVNSFLNAVINLVNKAPAYLQQTLENYPAHEPHYALYLSFLRLFQFAQNHLNQYTQNHLDFYYKDVLQITNRVAVPGFVHLLFTLQKNANAHLLLKGTEFKAGKGANNKDLFYALTNDLVIQKAEVALLKSLYLDKNFTALYASPIANSDDGQGGKLLSADKSWLPFGNTKKIAKAIIGFAVASNVLYLNEGKRAIVLTFTCDSLKGITAADISKVFTIQLTGKKGWYTVDNYSIKIINTNSFLLSIIFNGDAPSIIPYSQKNHGGKFNSTLPMLQVLLNDYKSYQKIKVIKIASIKIDVAAVVKNVSLQNDDGKIDAAKPFKPFGEFPESGASLIIGSKEIFQKKLTALLINTDWQQAPQSNTNADAVVLNEGQWSITPFANGINLSNGMINLSGLNNIAQSAADFSPNDDYQITSVDGFIKLRLNNSDYSIKTYLSTVKNSISQTSVTIKKDGDGNVTGFQLNSPNVQEVPLPPVAKSMSIEYASRELILFHENTQATFDQRQSFYYHIEPFGYREMHPFVTADALNFLPVFDLDDGLAKDDGGELWIGLTNAEPGQTFSILFQASDGTANPLKNMTDVSWYYLSNNNWKKFDHLSITDDTNNLTRSGLVIFNVHAAATTNNTRANDDYLWIRLVVNHDADAVCNLIDVLANGAKASFVQDLNKGIEFTTPIAPATISKPSVADAAIKKTDQPFPSFDGRPHETKAQFYTRVSERLRHKQRAIACWDYERLVLQHYPQIHKVKCINHTGFIINDKINTQKYSELLTGHIMVVIIPDLMDSVNANILRPYTSVGLLIEIQQYLSALTSPFVRLHVTNPQFEEIQFDFEVSFYPNYDVVFYTNLLSNEIEQFLTPWAFQTVRDIEFGGTIEKSVVLNFIEERSYVDFVTCFKMNHIIKRDGSLIVNALYDVEEAIASTARSVLVSYFNEETLQNHIISSPANCNCNA
jgi:hypothetical protein